MFNHIFIESICTMGKVSQLKAEVKHSLEMEKKRKKFECIIRIILRPSSYCLWGQFCDFSHKNQYQKVKASGLSLQEHHILYDCTRNRVSEEDALDPEIAQRIKRWKEKKAEEKKARVSCPFGCGKSWVSIHSHSVKLHVLEKCPQRKGNEEKLKGFYKRKSLVWDWCTR